MQICLILHQFNLYVLLICGKEIVDSRAFALLSHTLRPRRTELASAEESVCQWKVQDLTINKMCLFSRSDNC